MAPQVTQLRSILQDHFPWHQARITFTAAFILALIKLCTVNFTQLANALNGKVKQKSNYRRIQRFFAAFDIPYDAVTRPVLHLLPVKSGFTVALDRTNWQLGTFNINILTAGVIHHGVAFPLCWHLLPKQGNSNTAERIALMTQRLKHIRKSQLRRVVADREFIGKEWFRWLDTQHIPFAIRIKENAQVSSGHQDIPVRTLFANLQIHQQTVLRKPRRVYDHSLYLCAIRLRDEWLILASQTQGQEALQAYKERWGIEVLFANLKSRGFDIEQTHLGHEERIEKLIALLTLALTWAHLVGEWRAKITPLKVKTHGRKEKSLFRYGLDYLQYVLLNSNQQGQAVSQCMGVLRKPTYFTPP